MVPAVPGGTTALIDPDDVTVNAALTPPKLTLVAPAKLDPERVTVFPPGGGPLAGDTPVTTGQTTGSATNPANAVALPDPQPVAGS